MKGNFSYWAESNSGCMDEWTYRHGQNLMPQMPRDNGIDQLFYTQSGFRYFDLRAHVWWPLCWKSHVLELDCFLVQKRSPYCLLILKSWPMSPTYFYHMSFMKMLKINKKFVWLKVASVNISCNTVPDCITFPIDEAYAPA
jgi:hypothetical protein